VAFDMRRCDGTLAPSVAHGAGRLDGTVGAQGRGEGARSRQDDRVRQIRRAHEVVVSAAAAAAAAFALPLCDVLRRAVRERAAQGALGQAVLGP
jgi:hypothetical protein